jgi:hypothetical protein
MKKIFASLCLVACGGANAQTPAAVTVAAVTPASTTPVSPPAKPLELVQLYETHAPESEGVALDGTTLYFDVKGTLQVVDAHGPVAPGRSGDRRIAVGPDLFDPVSFAKHTPPLPKGFECDEIAFSADVTRMSAYCHDAQGQDAVYVYDARNGAQLAKFDDWHSAAPIRTGRITLSGNFIFWSARASGAFEEIKSRVTGPMMSSLSDMSADESMLFTTPNKNWYTDDTTPAKILNPKNGRVIYELTNDIDGVTFPPAGPLFAVHHKTTKGEWVTVHSSATSFARLEATRIVFGRDGKTLAAFFPNGIVRVHSIDARP